jgi:hypothetical protein
MIQGSRQRPRLERPSRPLRGASGRGKQAASDSGGALGGKVGACGLPRALVRRLGVDYRGGQSRSRRDPAGSCFVFPRTDR